MKKKYIIANWKMELTPQQAQQLAQDFAQVTKKNTWAEDRQVIICPSFTDIIPIVALLSHSQIEIGAQDVFWSDYGAYTGSISASSLRHLGCTYVIVGHSERRKYQHETDREIGQKIAAVLQAGLVPILCIGETFAERQGGGKEAALMKQLTEALSDIHLTDKDNILVAYEPVWVIGSGQAVNPQDANQTHQLIRRTLGEFWPTSIVNKIGIIYGGSVNHLNIKDFMYQPNIDGVLVGGASLSVDKFWPIINY